MTQFSTSPAFCCEQLPLPLPILFESRRKKVQRFLSLPFLNIENIWFPILKNWLSQTFQKNQPIHLVIDRTLWQRKNLIMISIVYDKRAIPVYFEFLPKLESSNFSEQTKLISQVIPLFEEYEAILLEVVLKVRLTVNTPQLCLPLCRLS